VLGGLTRGGAETTVMNLYRSIDRTQIQFDFIIHTNEHQAYYNEILELGGRIYKMPRFRVINLFRIISKWNSIFTNHPEYKILHSHVRSYASIYIPIAKKHGIKTIIHSHSTSNGNGIEALIKKILQYPLRKQADFFIGCTRKAGEWLFGKNIVNSERFQIVNNSIDIRKYHYNHEIREQYRLNMGINNDVVFIHIGRFHKSKNHTFLINVFSKLHKINEMTKLVLVGDGELRNEVQSHIDSQNLHDSVILTGSRSDVPNLLQASDCFLFPSKWEGLPVSVIEAQASGIPCLVSNNITKDILLSNLVIPLPINMGIEPWIKAISELSFKRKNVEDQIKKAGYDINDSVKIITFIYMKLNA